MRSHENLFQTDADSFSFLSSKKKKIFFGHCQYQNKKALVTDSIFWEGFGLNLFCVPFLQVYETERHSLRAMDASEHFETNLICFLANHL